MPNQPLNRIIREAAPIGLLFTVLFFLFYGGANAFCDPGQAWRVPSLPFEHSIPFSLEWSVAYVSLYPLMFSAIFVFPSRREIYPLFLALLTELVLASIIFVAFPSVVTFHIPTQNQVTVFEKIFLYADIVNLNCNAFPSLHVAFACTIYDFYSRKLSKTTSLVILTWAVTIVLSTILTKQHTLLDALAGLIVAITANLVTTTLATRFGATPIFKASPK